MKSKMLIVLAVAGLIAAVPTRTAEADRSSQEIVWIGNRQPKPLYIKICAMHGNSTLVMNTAAGQVPVRVTEEIMKQMTPSFIGRMMVLAHDWKDPTKAVGFVLKSRLEQHQEFGHCIIMIIKVVEEPAIDRVIRGSFRFISVGLTVEGGKFIGQEVSFINVPQCRYAMVLEHSWKPIE